MCMLGIGQNIIGTEGAKTIASALSLNNGVTSIDLSNNAIGAGGGDAFAKMLSENKTLTALYLGN